MKSSFALLRYNRLIFTVALLLAASGWLAWNTMPRQEDPKLPDRVGLITVPFPGADPADVERLILEPIEDQLVQVDDVDEIVSTARSGFAAITVRLRDDVSEEQTDGAWDDVREALEVASRDLPEGAIAPKLDDDRFAQDSIVIALSGGAPFEMIQSARALQERFQKIGVVKRVNLFGDPGEQITIQLSDASAARYGLTAEQVAGQLAARNVTTPGGALLVGQRKVALAPLADFGDIDEIRQTPLMLPGGASAPLEQVAAVTYGPAEPALGMMRLDGDPVIGIGIVPRQNIDLAAFGERIQRELDEVQPSLSSRSLSTRVVFMQPERLRDRLGELGRSLVQGTLIVACVLILFMGIRLGALVSSIVPLVAFATLGIYSWFGGVLHQMSIAAMVIALGLLVDNAIVMAESIQLDLDSGMERREAIQAAIRQLAFPLMAATGTTLAAFIPMLLAQGPTGDFTRAIPTVVMLALAVSLVFALAVTPVLAGMVLRARPQVGASGFDKLGSYFASASMAAPLSTLLVVGIAMGMAVWGMQFIPRQFFPEADRNQLLIDIELPEGSHITQTDEVVRRLEHALSERASSDVNVALVEFSSYIGQEVPHFYYNVVPRPNSPHIAQVVVKTESVDDVRPLARWVREISPELAPAATIIPSVLQQGPPVRAPIEVRVFAEDLETLTDATEKVTGIVANVSATVDTRHDLGQGLPSVEIAIEDRSAVRKGLARADVARAVYGRTTGLMVGQYRGGEEMIPVLVRSPGGERFGLEKLGGVRIVGQRGEVGVLGEVASTALRWQPAVIYHRDMNRTASVLAELRPGQTFSDALPEIERGVAAADLPEGVEVQMAGQAKESGSANANVLRNMPLGLLVLLFFLLLEFRSFRRVGIILLTVPLAIVGVVPGLLIGGAPFGFMSLLGTIALIGILVNNAIVLIDRIEAQRESGASVFEAVREAVIVRTRPILLTAMTTIAGMLPLALSKTSLWPPMAWTIIFGLVAATFLSLMVVPAFYILVFDPRQPHAKLWRAAANRLGRFAAASALFAVLAASGVMFGSEEAHAQQVITLDAALELATRRPQVEASRRRVEMARGQVRIQRRLALFPTLAASASAVARAPELVLETPIGDLQQGEQRFLTASAQIRQPLFMPGLLFGGVPAARERVGVAEVAVEVDVLEVQREITDAFFDVLELQAQRDAQRALIENLDGQLERIDAARRVGAATRNDVARVALARDQARQRVFAIEQGMATAMVNLGRALGEEDARAPDFSTGVAASSASSSVSLDDALDASKNRPELEALRRQAATLDARVAEVRWERAPSLSATGALVYSNEGRISVDTVVQSALVLEWVPFAAGTRSARVDILEAERLELRHRLTEAERAIALEVTATWNALASARFGAEVAASQVELGEDNLGIQRALYDSGEANIVDVVEAETLLAQAVASRSVAKLQIERQRVLLRLICAL